MLRSISSWGVVIVDSVRSAVVRRSRTVRPRLVTVKTCNLIRHPVEAHPEVLVIGGEDRGVAFQHPLDAFPAGRLDEAGAGDRHASVRGRARTRRPLCERRGGRGL